MARLLTGLRGLPGSAPRTQAQVPLRDNLRLIGLHDLVTGQAAETVAELTRYDLERLLAETHRWATAPAAIA